MSKLNKFITSSSIIIVILIVANSGLLSKPLEAGNPKNGQRMFEELLCTNCHGTRGEGSSAANGGGPKLAPDPAPLSVYLELVRRPRLNMPPYPEERASDQDIADIHAYLKGL